MTSTDATGQDADKGFAELLALPENKGVELVAHEHFNTTDVSVTAQIENIKAANPQAFIAWSTGAPSATMFRGAVQSGLTLPDGHHRRQHDLRADAPLRRVPAARSCICRRRPGRSTAIRASSWTRQRGAKQKELYAAFAAVGAKPDEG